MNPSFDLIDWFFGLSLFKQLALLVLCGPLAASIWALIADRRRTVASRAVAAGDHDEELRRAA